jgi:hypothetical protein
VVPSGLPEFHAAWYGQSGYLTLCAGERSSAVVAFALIEGTQWTGDHGVFWYVVVR